MSYKIPAYQSRVVIFNGISQGKGFAIRAALTTKKGWIFRLFSAIMNKTGLF